MWEREGPDGGVIRREDGKIDTPNEWQLLTKRSIQREEDKDDKVQSRRCDAHIGLGDPHSFLCSDIACVGHILSAIDVCLYALLCMKSSPSSVHTFLWHRSVRLSTLHRCLFTPRGCNKMLVNGCTHSYVSRTAAITREAGLRMVT